MSTSTVLRSNSQLSDAIRSEFRELPLREILHRSPRALLGVTEDAEKALAKLEIVTVFDLATSAAITSAVRILEAGTDLHSAHAIFGAPTADLALYRPFRTATELLTTLYLPENTADFDPERPTDLADLAALAAGDSGFQTVAFGALLTFNQSWFAQGVTLGQLLHSMSLAPGESTRIAVIDWSRRSRAGETEVISETDDLTNDTSQNRAISEVTNAVATEAQSGFSHAKTNSTSRQEGTSSSATTDASADSYTSSFGRRDVSSSMMQNVNDRTHQHAHSSRSRRASVVKEVSQSEHEGVSTRVIANYNHMHALAKADRVIFIPIKLLDFTADDMIRRFRGALSRAAISYEIREALDNLDVVEIRPDRTTRFTSLDTGITDWLRSAVVIATRVQPLLAIREAVAPTAMDAAAPAAALTAVAESAVIRVRAATAIPIVQRVNDQLWSAGQSARLSGLLNRAVLRQDSASIYLPIDVSIESVLVDAGGAPVTVVFGLRGGGVDTSVSATDPLPLNDVTRIALTGSSPERNATVNRNGVRFPIELPAVTVAKARTAETPLATVEPGGVNANLKRHLTKNRLHYSQAALRSAAESGDPAALQSVWGDTQSPSRKIDKIDKIVDKVGLGSTDPSAPAGGLTTRKAWPHLDPTLVTTRVHDLIANPNLFNQGALGLCTSAAFFHHVLQRKGPQFQSFANALFGAGVGYVGELKVSPGSDPRNVDYAAHLTKFPFLPPQAVWMVMSAKELSECYESTGFYTGVSFSDSTGIPAVKAIKKTATNYIALWITADLVAPGSNATHMITLETPFVINEVADSIIFDYWTWGQPIKTMETKLSTFVAAQLGTITATF